MLVIAITGIIGSGKTTASDYFQKKGAYYISLDQLSIKVRENPKIIKKLQQLFGFDIFNQNQLDTVKIKKVIFNNPEKRAQLNAIMWPKIKKALKQELKNQQEQPIIIVEGAAILEANWKRLINKFIYVTCDYKKCLQRVSARDNLEINTILNIINQQNSYEKYKDIIDYQLFNNGTKEELYSQIDTLIDKAKLPF